MVRFLYLILAALIIGYLIWPFTSLLRFYFALKQSDPVAVESMVDWESVRHNFSQEFNQSLIPIFNGKLDSVIKKPGFKIHLSFDSISLSDIIAAEISTPEMFIFLFHGPDKLHCLKTIRKILDDTSPDDCQIVENQIAAKEKSGISFSGPNFSRIFEKTNYIFFTDLFTFEFSVLHQDIPIVLIFKRRLFSWKLTRLNIGLEKITNLFSDMK